MYISGIIDCLLERVELIGFADDMEECLRRIEVTATKINIFLFSISWTIYLSKCSVVIFGPEFYAPKSHEIKICGISLFNVDFFKYLGAIFQQDLK